MNPSQKLLAAGIDAPKYLPPPGKCAQGPAIPVEKEGAMFPDSGKNFRKPLTDMLLQGFMATGKLILVRYLKEVEWVMVKGS